MGCRTPQELGSKRDLVGFLRALSYRQALATEEMKGTELGIYL